nr:hypothetical protein Itr_chr13CG13970 [Ipomoea trifida]
MFASVVKNSRLTVIIYVKTKKKRYELRLCKIGYRPTFVAISPHLCCDIAPPLLRLGMALCPVPIGDPPPPSSCLYRLHNLPPQPPRCHA